MKVNLSDMWESLLRDIRWYKEKNDVQYLWYAMQTYTTYCMLGGKRKNIILEEYRYANNGEY